MYTCTGMHMHAHTLFPVLLSIFSPRNVTLSTTPTTESCILAATVVEKAKSWGSFFTTLLGSIADWLIRLCNRISRNYRLVADKLEGELRVEKEKIKVREDDIGSLCGWFLGVFTANFLVFGRPSWECEMWTSLSVFVRSSPTSDLRLVL